MLAMYMLSRPKETAWRFEQYWRKLQRYARSTSIPSFWATPALSSGDHSSGTIRPGHSVESRSQTDSKIESASLSHSGLCTKFSRSSTAIHAPRLIWMVFADPSVIAKTRHFHLCHRLRLTNGTVGNADALTILWWWFFNWWLFGRAALQSEAWAHLHLVVVSVALLRSYSLQISRC